MHQNGTTKETNIFKESEENVLYIALWLYIYMHASYEPYIYIYIYA
jgi:hypothetical protein